MLCSYAVSSVMVTFDFEIRGDFPTRVPMDFDWIESSGFMGKKGLPVHLINPERVLFGLHFVGE